MTDNKSNPTVVKILLGIVVVLAGIYTWAFFAAGVFNFSSSSQTSSSSEENSATKTFNVKYLAVRANNPAPKDPIPVADKATMQALIQAAASNDRSRYISIAKSPSVSQIPGGSIVDVLSASDGLAEVKLHSRDIKGVDLSGQTRWTSSEFIQSREIVKP